MSDKLGPRTYGKREEMVFLGKEIHEQRNYSERVALRIDQEVDSLIQRAHEQARAILSGNKARLKLIAERLITVETIDESGFEELMKQQLPSAEVEATPAS
jgi:cell division protease FtsH